MKTSKYTPEQKLQIVLDSLRGEKTLSHICREQGITRSVYYKWRDKFMKGALSGLSSSGLKRHKLVDENSDVKQLKQIIGDLTIENQILKKTQEILKQI